MTGVFNVLGHRYGPITPAHPTHSHRKSDGATSVTEGMCGGDRSETKGHWIMTKWTLNGAEGGRQHRSPHPPKLRLEIEPPTRHARREFASRCNPSQPLTVAGGQLWNSTSCTNWKGQDGGCEDAPSTPQCGNAELTPVIAVMVSGAAN